MIRGRLPITLEQVLGRTYYLVCVSLGLCVCAGHAVEGDCLTYSFHTQSTSHLSAKLLKVEDQNFHNLILEFIYPLIYQEVQHLEVAFTDSDAKKLGGCVSC